MGKWYQDMGVKCLAALIEGGAVEIGWNWIGY